MSWIFWILVMISMLLLLAPLFGVPPLATAILWSTGLLVLIIVVTWAIISLYRAPAPPA